MGRKERGMSDYLISVVDATSAFPTPKENREYQTSNLDDAYDKGWDDCQLYIGTLPPIDAVPVRKGRWLSDASGYGFWVCSCCKFPSEAFAANVLYKFCPNCGARMEQKE